MATTTATKTSRTLQASASNSAAGTTTGTGVDLTTRLGPHLAIGRITNGGTGPTIGCDFVLQVSPDNSTWYEFSRARAGTVNSAVYDFAVEVPIGTMYIRSVFVGNTGQAVTVESHLQELTSASTA